MRFHKYLLLGLLLANGGLFAWLSLIPDAGKEVGLRQTSALKKNSERPIQKIVFLPPGTRLRSREAGPPKVQEAGPTKTASQPQTHGADRASIEFLGSMQLSSSAERQFFLKDKRSGRVFRVGADTAAIRQIEPGIYSILIDGQQYIFAE